MTVDTTEPTLSTRPEAIIPPADFVVPEFREIARCALSDLEFAEQLSDVAVRQHSIISRFQKPMVESRAVELLGEQDIENRDIQLLESFFIGTRVPVLQELKNYAGDLGEMLVIGLNTSLREYEVEGFAKDEGVDSRIASFLGVLARISEQLEKPVNLNVEDLNRSGGFIREANRIWQPNNGKGTNGDLLAANNYIRENAEQIIDDDGSIVQTVAIINILQGIQGGKTPGADRSLMVQALLTLPEFHVKDYLAYLTLPKINDLFSRKNKRRINKAVVANIDRYFDAEKYAQGMNGVRAIIGNLAKHKPILLRRVTDQLEEMSRAISLDESEDFDITEKLKMDTLRAEIARRVLAQQLGIGDHAQHERLQYLAERPAHAYVLAIAGLEVKNVHQEAQNDISAATETLDGRYKTGAKVVRSIDNGVSRRKNIQEGLSDVLGDQINVKDAEQILVITDEIVTNGTIDARKFAELKNIIGILETLNLDASRLDARKTDSSVLRAVKLLQEIYEVLDISDINKVDSDLAILARSLFDVDFEHQIDDDPTPPEYDDDSMLDILAQLPEEEVVIFPPHSGEIDSVIEDYIGILESEKFGSSYLAKIEWERAYKMVELRDELNSRANTASELMIVRSNPWSPVPFFVLETMIGDTTVAVVESPLYGHASYVVRSDEWRDIVGLTREEARILGAKQKVHSTDLVQHKSKLRTAIVVG